jgi:phosphoribulokinase
VELIVEPVPVPLSTLPLPFDLAAMLEANQPPFLLAAVPCTYWGRQVMITHIDGVLSQLFDRTVRGIHRRVYWHTN